ncbi:hypothetical protein MC885_019435, partial [Smutsia gigantea]
GPNIAQSNTSQNSDRKTQGMRPYKKLKAPQVKASLKTCLRKKKLEWCQRPDPQFIVGACPVGGKEGPGPQELPPQEAVSFHPDDEDSSDLDMEQLLEEVGKELEQRE